MAFLFTDIEGSTNRWEEHHDAMRAAVARHDLLLRADIERYGGFVFKTVGDAFCAAFNTPQQALQAAVAGQRSLYKEDFSSVGGLRVRMGIHVGTAVERDLDYYGPTLNRVARLMSIGHGGQVLVSDAVQNAVTKGLVGETTLVDLGLRRLKDLMQPEHVWQLSIAGLPSDFAPLTSLDARPNNLPVQPTALLGRERELDAIKRMLSEHRLVTISGAGGVGKTRLALQVAADLLDRYEHGVWFADLAPISDQRLAPSAVAQALEVKQSGDAIETSIVEALKHRNLLLILDNCEHVLDTIAKLADAVLKQCAHVRILTTSRQSLGIAGEFLHRLPSLGVPEPAMAATAASARSFGAVALFTERAMAADSRFALTDASAPVVAEICRRLDGIPLAIELAAARVRVLAVPTLAKRLDERFKILTSGSRIALPRQKTLSALIDWSYGLLDRREQMFFNRTSVFAGGFTLDAAAAVCGDADIDEAEVVDLLSSLTDKSLILADTSQDEERYRLLESTRAFALEMLEGANERALVERRHAEYFRRFAGDADVRHRSEPSEAWLTLEEPEIDNLRSALGWALHAGNDPLLGAEIAGALASLWLAVGLNAEARSWIGLALDRLDADTHPVAVARLRLALSTLSAGSQNHALAVQACEVFERIGDEAATADALYAIAWQVTQAGRQGEGDEAIDRAIAIYRRSGPPLALARGIAMKAIVAESREDFPASRSLNREAIAMLRALGCVRLVGAALTNLGATELLAGNYQDAQRISEEALAVFLPGKNHRDLTIVYDNLAINFIMLDDTPGARQSARNAVHHARAMRDPLYVAEAVIHLACVGARERKMDDAARVFGYVCRQYEAHGLANRAADHKSGELVMEWLGAHFNATELERLKAEGAAWTEDKAVDVAMEM